MWTRWTSVEQLLFCFHVILFISRIRVCADILLFFRLLMQPDFSYVFALQGLTGIERVSPLLKMNDWRETSIRKFLKHLAPKLGHGWGIVPWSFTGMLCPAYTTVMQFVGFLSNSWSRKCLHCFLLLFLLSNFGLTVDRFPRWIDFKTLFVSKPFKSNRKSHYFDGRK